MNTFDVHFITELFLESDSNLTINRLAVTVANVIYENVENMNAFNEVLRKDFNNVLQSVDERRVKSDYNSKCHKYKNTGFYEQTVKTFNEDDYKTHLKLKKSTVEALVTYLHENIKSDNTRASLHKKIHIFLYLLTTDLSFNDVAALFILQRSSVSSIFYEIVAMLSDLKDYFINWPSLDEQHITRLKVNSRFQFPNCVGFIDACRFKVGSRRTKKYLPDTVLLQAVCDESLMFTHIHVGSVGKTKKNKVFKESKLSHELKSSVDFDNHILGDAEYKLKYNLLTPFSTEELLTSEEMKFNEVHWRTRSYIGHAFELLKEKFTKLSHLDFCNPEAVERILNAACVLHNFILLQEGYPEIKKEALGCDDGIHSVTMNIDTNIVKTPDEKRQFICNYINYIIFHNISES
ncbi:uncharacterized protein LOC128680741 [Plodia interpunctella]|uniref:uncharacterized protein LOC128680741 n=1 Tax=Plodia interpunctella TaxID=58824 RepID=UPI00236764B1|nr:uncharacterized protein LOC128680741 [Plodia interpunctella]